MRLQLSCNIACSYHFSLQYDDFPIFFFPHQDAGIGTANKKRLIMNLSGVTVYSSLYNEGKMT
jgi:hypothetical protein